MRFLLDNDVDYGVAIVLRRHGHDAVTAHEVGLAGVDSAEDDALTVYGSDRGRVVVTHDRDFTARRKRNTIGLHVRIRVEQPDAPEVMEDRLDDLLDALVWTESAVIESSARRCATIRLDGSRRAWVCGGSSVRGCTKRGTMRHV